MEPCQRKTVFGQPACRFEARYDRGAPAVPGMNVSDPSAVPAIVESFKSQTYVRDVCIRCGRTIERQKP